jgi:Flp pilus assembly protein TadD
MESMQVGFCRALGRSANPAVHAIRGVRLLRHKFRPALAAFLIAGLSGCAGVERPQEPGDPPPDVALPQAIRMAEAVRTGGDITGAAVFYRRAHALAPEDPRPLIGLADAASAAGSYESAVDLYRKASVLAPGNAAGRLGYGRALLSLGLSDLARAELRAAIAADPEDYRGYLALGVALDLGGETLEAQRIYQSGLQRNPGNLSLQNNLALSLALSGRTGEAIDMLRVIARQPVGGLRVRQNLALVHAIAGDLNEAEAIAAHDLRGAQLLHHLAFLRSLQGLNGARLAAAVMCACNPGQLSNRVAEPEAEAQLSLRSPVPPSSAPPRRSQATARTSPDPADGHTATITKPRVSEVIHGSKTLVVVGSDAGDMQTAGPEVVSEERTTTFRKAEPDISELGDFRANLISRVTMRTDALPDVQAGGLASR